MKKLVINMMRCLVQVLLLTSILCYPVDRDSDEKRPYEFGFTIDGEQHRYEKKDENGLIMGEFGFITADGIYHVTVYATDENGDFKIISMKNIKVGFPPGKTTTSTTTAKPKSQTKLLLNGIRGCSGCLIPEASPTMAPKGYPPGSRAFNKMDLGDDRNSDVNKDQYSSIFANTPMNRFKATDNSETVPPSYKEYGREQQRKQEPRKSATAVPSTIPNSISNQGYIKQLDDKTQSTQIPGSRQTTKLFQERLTPILIQNKNSSIDPKSQPQLNEVEMKILDYMARLYKFNYTLSFHGHEEMGDYGGNKNGSYFSNGRDGYQRKVAYIANEFGYQPKISLIKVDDEFIPKEETEKELTKLKGSEFIWFNKKK